MKFPYSKAHPQQMEAEKMPRLPIRLRLNRRTVEATALIDSGATVNILPFSLGEQLGLTWDDRAAILPLAGVAGGENGIPVRTHCRIADEYNVDLAFAWIKGDNLPVILGQMNFFHEFRVCFERYNLEFEITPKPK